MGAGKSGKHTGKAVINVESRLELSVDRAQVAESLGAILDGHKLLDMSVQDPPLEQMIARIFEGAKGD